MNALIKKCLVLLGMTDWIQSLTSFAVHKKIVNAVRGNVHVQYCFSDRFSTR